jgi:filamentous hemagglutinin
MNRTRRQGEDAESAAGRNPGAWVVGAACALAMGAVPLMRALAATLPVPCATGSCGTNGPATWVTSGSATFTQAGAALNVTQNSPTAVLNWRSFNISSDGIVTFQQPNAAAVALNQIFQADPSKILGALNANGTIYLINQNGILFGAGAQVNVGSLVASSLNLTPDALNGILQAGTNGHAAFAGTLDAQGNPLSGAVQVAKGATLQAAAGGQIMLFAPTVMNSGVIRADGGQVILAAGNEIYLAPSSDPNLRGLLVEVGHGGTVTNSAASAPGAGDSGQVAANHGDVTLVGLIVNQLGRVSATTTVQENGSIRLLAENNGGIQAGPNGGTLLPVTGGTLTLGAGSQTDVNLELGDKSSAVDATVQPRSFVDLSGAAVTMVSGSEITATSGHVSIAALQNMSSTVLPSGGADLSTITAQPAQSRVVIESGASIDVSGANIQLPVSSNVIAVQLRGTELADSPVQRNGPLRGQTVFVDTRQSGVRADGTSWQGTPVGDVSGYISAVQRNVGQRNLTGGSIALSSDGAVFVEPHAQLNVSGGSIEFQSGFVNTTKLLGANGQVYDIAQANPLMSYLGVARGASLTDPKWGVTQNFQGLYAGSFGQYQAGYVEGKDAGSLSIDAPRLVLDANVTATTVEGPYQRQVPGAIPAGALYRPFNQAPLGAQLILGGTAPIPVSGLTDHILSNVTFAPGLVSDSLNGPNGGPFNPLTDPLPDLLGTVQVRPDLFGSGQFTGLTILANGKVSIPQGLSLDLSSGGSLSVTSGAIDVQGTVRIPSGSIVLAAGGTIDALTGTLPSTVTLGANSALNVSGLWVNDQASASALPGTSLIATNGGSVSLNPGGIATLKFETGSFIDVSGGAHRSPSG